MFSQGFPYDKKLDKEVAAMMKHFKMEQYTELQLRKITFEQFLSDKFLMIYAIRQGIPYSFFDKIQDFVPLTDKDWADVLDISTKSLQRYKQADKNFRPIQSEKIIEIAEVTKIGLEVFGEMDKFKLWLRTPNFGLGGIKPFDLLKDSYGKDLVVAALIRIQNGIFI